MTTSTAEAEQAVETSRGELDRTMEALKDKMTPGQLLDEATRTMGGAGQQILSKFIDQAKENPMPLAVMGMGLAWMISSNRKAAHAPRQGDQRQFGDVGDGAWLDDGSGDRMHILAGRTSVAMSSAKDKAEALASNAVQSAKDAGDRISDAVSSATDKASEYRYKAQQGLSDLFAREPLLVGGLGLILGLAVGSALPSTDTEDRVIGPVRDKVVEKTKAVAEEQMKDAAEVAQAALRRGKGRPRGGQGGSPGRPRPERHLRRRHRGQGPDRKELLKSAE